ncbi:MAG: hypothetical protein H7A09_04140 [Oceanospirillaceae bacterium]|nr:hypothetical protein [Oceanospirillaceae bacterium]MCP5335223.1 hypothetical protein [Oceanospirillaceae bacterium]
MKKLTQAVAAASLISAGLMGAQVAQAEVSFSVAGTSNYVWRGVTQTNDASALQGSVGYSVGGLSLSVWQSSVVNDTETDYVGSYSVEAGPVALSAGFIAYDYNTDPADFTEVYLSASAMDVTLAYYKRVDDKDENKDTDDQGYVTLDYSYALAEDLSLGLGLHKVVELAGASKYDGIVSVTKTTPEFDFTLALTDKEDAENEFVMTVSKGF